MQQLIAYTFTLRLQMQINIHPQIAPNSNHTIAIKSHTHACSIHANISVEAKTEELIWERLSVCEILEGRDSGKVECSEIETQ